MLFNYLLVGLLGILNFSRTNTTEPAEYETLTPKPRLTLRAAGPTRTGKLVMDGVGALANITTTLSYFDSDELSLMLNKTVLTTYWADLRAMLDQTRYLKEAFRLSPAHILKLDYSVPVWLNDYGDYFAISKVLEFSPHRPTIVELVRLNAAHLPPPILSGEGLEFYAPEFLTPAEFY